MKTDIHDYAKGLRRELEALDKDQISDHNRAVIKRFYDDNAVQGISKPDNTAPSISNPRLTLL